MPYGDRTNEVVFIGRFKDRVQNLKVIEQAFAECQLEPFEVRKGIDYWRKMPDQFPQWTPLTLASEGESEYT